MLQTFYCSFVWLIVSCFIVWRSIEITKKAVSHLQRLHQIPCANCAFFTGDYRLKCTVHPITAMSEEAIDCCDFIPNTQQQVFSCRCPKSSKLDRPLAKI
jgi:hypothetical protein